MESYKHSCPRCGQHIEFTAGYCGMQIPCPSCGHLVTFPAIPPGRSATSARGQAPAQKPGAKSKLAKKAAVESASQWSWTGKGMLLYLRDFQHWNVVVQCAVPFLIIGALLAGAILVNRNFGDPTDPASGPAIQAEPGAWQRMTDLTKADEAVQVEVRSVAMARAALDLAQQGQRRLQTTDSLVRKGVDEKVAGKQRNIAFAQKRFDDAFKHYQDLGGRLDYRSQLPKN
jgi:DNA-directed RNA polymerase subunit RPC12/RpoP